MQNLEMTFLPSITYLPQIPFETLIGKAAGGTFMNSQYGSWTGD